MKNIIGLLREGINKKGEMRSSITPDTAEFLIKSGFMPIVQPAKNPETGERKRIFKDSEYKKAGAEISDDLSFAKIIFGLKEIPTHRILPKKVYLLFSHTHKGQIKNRKMLRTFAETKSTIIDYELVRDEKGNRIITAFTYNAGYAGLVDTLWSLGKRLKLKNIKNVFEEIPQAIEGQDLIKVRNILQRVGKKINSISTPEEIPPIIVCILGKGKTAKGVRRMLDILPHSDVQIAELERIYKSDERNKISVLQIDVEEIYRFKEKFSHLKNDYDILSTKAKQHYYFENPEQFESNLDKIIPFTTVILNCILWSDKYPRTITHKLINKIHSKHKTLEVIGDITCDPNGSIEFSKETWIDNPVFIYNPKIQKIKDGFEGEGIAVMAVTNLPCEFSEDASREFSEDLQPYLLSIASANFNGTLHESGLPMEIKRAVILWKGEFTNHYKYMKKFIE